MSGIGKRMLIVLIACVAAGAVSSSSLGCAREAAVELPVGDGDTEETALAVAVAQVPAGEAAARTPMQLSHHIDRMFRSDDWRGVTYNVWYEPAREHFSQADVPALIAILEDPSQTEKWGAIVDLLGFIDTEGESADALIAFIYRVDDWKHFPYPRDGYEMLCKMNAIRTLGFVGGDAETEVLHVLVTKEGAQQYLNEWSDDALETTHVSRSFVRGRAAEGWCVRRKPRIFNWWKHCTELNAVEPSCTFIRSRRSLSETISKKTASMRGNQY